jgi:voltage-gated potassium channel
MLIGLIVVTLLATILESVPSMNSRYSVLFSACELAATVVFTVEYLLRLWTANEHPPFHHMRAFRAGLRFAASPSGLIDLAAVLPLWLTFLISPDFKVILVLRLIRFFKLTRYSPAMRSLLDVLYAERRALTGCFVILCGTTLVAAALMHLAEHQVQPEKFGTLPDAMWWAIVTLGTVGYGDVVPVTPLGRLLTGVTIFAGLLMVALPVGIVASSFASEVHRRDFVITWGMLARIPLFKDLTAAQIADVMKYLHARKVEAGVTIARRGEPAHSMYVIADGEVEIRLPHERVRLTSGHFFGEIAALRRTRRSATATAVVHTRLLVLDAVDLHALMDREPEIATRVHEAARNRLGGESPLGDGDLLATELKVEAHDFAARGAENGSS